MFHLKKSDYLILFLFILVLITPICEVFVPYENKTEDESWELRFIWEDLISFLCYCVLCLLWFFTMFNKKNIIKFVLLFFSIINLVGVFLSVITPSQDLIFKWGLLFYVLLCIALIIYVIFDKNKNRIDLLDGID